jgi:enoyl-CoA hydratase/carnithine racemase
MSMDAAAFERMKYELVDHVVRISLNRPERRNALDHQAYDEIEAAFRTADADPEVRCVILTGVDPAFCSGEDVRIMSGLSRPATPASDARPTPAAMAVLECGKPVIAAVNGPAFGWGMELALYADIRIASENAKFAELFIKRGLISDVGGFYRLPSIVGPAKAAQLLFTGEVIDAAEALRIGLVNEVVAHVDLIPRTQALAGSIAANPPLAMRAMKEGLRRATYGDPRELGTWALTTIRQLAKTADHREGVDSFLEKREPVFEGR